MLQILLELNEGVIEKLRKNEKNSPDRIRTRQELTPFTGGELPEPRLLNVNSAVNLAVTVVFIIYNENNPHF